MNEILLLVNQWTRLADGDIASAKHLLTLYPQRLEVICYLCEQSSEKYLKGFLCANKIEPPRTHDLMNLCRSCAKIDKSFMTILESCSNLTPYGVTVRYPNNIEIFEEDMKSALKDAQNIFDFIKPKIDTLLEIK